MKAYRNSPVCSWLLLLSLLCLWMSVQSSEDPSLPLRAVNLGGWLVTEGWITPSLFDKISQPDLLFGTKVQFMSSASGKYLTADRKEGFKIVANRKNSSSWETFKLWRDKEGQFHFRASKEHFVRLDGSRLVADAQRSDNSEKFQIIPMPGGQKDNSGRVRVHIKAMSSGKYVQAKSDGTVTADLSEEPGWEQSSTAVFLMCAFGRLQGEYQLTNGLGPRAAQVMQEHWDTFIVEKDFEFIANNGFNAVRIPVGWWTAETPTPHPFVEGSLHYLDEAFNWAGRHGLKVILDLHAPPDSPNGKEHSGTRGGTIEFGSQESIDRAVNTIEKFMERYAKFDNLFAVELLNEPQAPEVSLDAISKYYKAGYEVVRVHCPTAYVIMSDRLGNDKKGNEARPTELLDLAKGLPGTVIDVHYYNFFEERFKNMKAKENINFVLQDRASELAEITPADRVPLSFVGEWAAVWNADDIEKYQSFVDVQLKVYGGASFGWAYWTYRTERNGNWSIQWMIKEGYITPKKVLESGRV